MDQRRQGPPQRQAQDRVGPQRSRPGSLTRPRWAMGIVVVVGIVDVVDIVDDVVLSVPIHVLGEAGI